jgi:electron transport complex protein RnfE
MERTCGCASSQAPTPDVLALFALCPLFALSDTVANAAAASIAMFAVATGTMLIARMLPRWLDEEMAFASLAIIVTTVVAAISLVTHAWLPGTYESLGIFLPLIVSNVLLMARATRSTPEHTLKGELASTARTAWFVVLTMMTLAIAREIVGRGSVLRDSQSMFGLLSDDGSGGLHRQLFREDMGFLLAVLPPGAFIALGLLFALAKWWRQRR